MTLFDQTLESQFGGDVLPSVDAFGGLEAFLTRATELGQSKYADHYFDLVFPFRDTETSKVDQFLVELLMSVSYGPELSAIVDRLFGLSLSDAVGEKQVFVHFLSTASDRTASPLLRTASLKGALSFAGEDSVRIARMVAEISETASDDDPFYIAHAARIAGVLAGRHYEPALRQFLMAVREVHECGDQIDFEIGLMTLQNAIQAETSSEVLELLGLARASFHAAAERRETRYDAKIFSSAISMLLDFYEHKTPDSVLCLIKQMRSDAFAYAEYSGASESDPILGSVASQGLALIQLCENLQNLIKDIKDDIWLEAAATIEKHLLFAYSANRTIFNGKSGMGIDCVIRPTIEPRIFGNHHHAAALKAWLRDRSETMPQDLIAELDVSVKEYFDRGDGLDPIDAGGFGPLSPAQAKRVRSTDPKGYSLLSEIAEFSVTEFQKGVSVPLMRAVELLEAKLRDHEDYQIAEVQAAFRNLAFHLYSFLERRLNSSIEQDRSCAYLFQNGDNLPLEKALQQDFLGHARAARLPVDDEVKGVAAGRADLRYKDNAHEMIIEVKRELKDASFENLMASYGDQTVIYQTTNVKLGVMLVLDLSQDRPNTIHMDKHYETRRGDFLGDGTDRGVVIIKVPGRRGTPSDATKRAKPKRSRKGKTGAA